MKAVSGPTCAISCGSRGTFMSRFQKPDRSGCCVAAAAAHDPAASTANKATAVISGLRRGLPVCIANLS